MSATQERPADWQHFAAIPWCSRHLQEHDIIPWIPRLWQSHKFPIDDHLWRNTLNNANAITAFLLFYRQLSQPGQLVEEVKAFVSLEWGVGGYPGLAHGGITTVIFDEILGLHARLNRELKAIAGVYMTGYLNTSFVKPVKIPSTVLVISRIVKLESRKLWMTGEIQDAEETVLAKAECLFIAANTKL
ncbi:HotDog domain-containing protein [Xylariaceae sp. FL1651]|nr:HotDog domain-containing protein [Xylariaceae sp. FL1651]